MTEISNRQARTEIIIEELALEVQQHAPKSKQRQIALIKLIRLIQQSGKLHCKYKSQFPLEVYKEALQETFLEVGRKIDRYDPTKAKMLTWVNNLLYWRFVDVSVRYMKNLQQDSSLDSGSNSIYETLRKPLEEDFEYLLQRHHIKNNPSAKKIAAELHIFRTLEEKETFIFLIGALMTRLISLAKAAEIMGMEREAFGDILDLMKIEYSYLTEMDIPVEIGEEIW